jgi:hypothetical protein
MIRAGRSVRWMVILDIGDTRPPYTLRALCRSVVRLERGVAEGCRPLVPPPKSVPGLTADSRAPFAPFTGFLRTAGSAGLAAGHRSGSPARSASTCSYPRRSRSRSCLEPPTAWPRKALARPFRTSRDSAGSRTRSRPCGPWRARSPHPVCQDSVSRSVASFGALALTRSRVHHVRRPAAWCRPSTAFVPLLSSAGSGGSLDVRGMLLGRSSGPGWN